jgi:hypothetical protein
MREIIIDKTTDTETAIVTVKINEKFIKENYFFDIAQTDENILAAVNLDLDSKEYD